MVQKYSQDKWGHLKANSLENRIFYDMTTDYHLEKSQLKA